MPLVCQTKEVFKAVSTFKLKFFTNWFLNKQPVKLVIIYLLVGVFIFVVCFSNIVIDCCSCKSWSFFGSFLSNISTITDWNYNFKHRRVQLWLNGSCLRRPLSLEHIGIFQECTPSRTDISLIGLSGCFRLSLVHLWEFVVTVPTNSHKSVVAETFIKFFFFFSFQVVLFIRKLKWVFTFIYLAGH